MYLCMYVRMTTTSCGATGTSTAVHLFQKNLRICARRHTRQHRQIGALAGKSLKMVWLYHTSALVLVSDRLK